MFIQKIINHPSTRRCFFKFYPEVLTYHSCKVENIMAGTKSSTPEDRHEQFKKHETEMKPFQEKKEFFNEVDDIMIQLFQPFSSTSLSVLENNKDKITGFHLVVALSSFKKIYNEDLSHTNFLNETIFERDERLKELCSIITHNIHKLSAPDAVKIYSFLIKFKVPSSYITVRLLLQQIEKNIKQLSFRDFSRLAIHLKLNPSSKYIFENKSLYHKMSTEFILKIKSDFEDYNMEHICQSLLFVSVHYNTSKQSQLLGTFLDKLQSRQGEIKPQYLDVIFEAFAYMTWQPKGWIDVLHLIQAEMILKANEMNVNRIIHILRLMSEVPKRDMFKFKLIYNDRLIDIFIKKLISAGIGLETALNALRYIGGMSHSSPTLINYCCASYFERSVLSDNKIKNSAAKHLFLVNGMSNSSYKGVYWTNVENFFLNDDNKSMILKHNYKTLAILALNLAVLDLYPHYLLEKIFKDSSNISYDDSLCWTMAKIYVKIKSNPDYNGPMPTSSQLELMKQLFVKLQKKRGCYKLPLSGCIEKAVGGPEFVLNNVCTKFLHSIDHLMVFDKDKNPVPINTLVNTGENEFVYIEDLKLPADSKIILAHVYPDKWYLNNCTEPRKMRGAFNVYLETLKKIYPIVALNSRTWGKIPFTERTSYLKNLINSEL